MCEIVYLNTVGNGTLFSHHLFICFVFTSFIVHGTGTALSDDNGRTLVTTAPLSGGRETKLQLTNNL